MNINFELLFFSGCPSWRAGLQNLKASLEREQLSANIKLVEIKNNAEASSQKFLGSPSFRLNGEELLPETRSKYTLNCRLYHTPSGMRGAPTVEMLQEKICMFIESRSNLRNDKPDIGATQ